MKGRIKRANLQGGWQPLARQCDNFQIGRLMQRSKLRQLVTLANNRGIQNSRMGEVLPAMHNRVAKAAIALVMPRWANLSKITCPMAPGDIGALPIKRSG